MKLFYKKDYFNTLKQLEQEKLRYETDLEDYNEVKYQKMVVEEKLSKLEQKQKIKNKDYEQVIEKFNKKDKQYKNLFSKVGNLTKKVNKLERKIELQKSQLKDKDSKIKHLEEINKDLKSTRYLRITEKPDRAKSNQKMSSKKGVVLGSVKAYLRGQNKVEREVLKQ